MSTNKKEPVSPKLPSLLHSPLSIADAAAQCGVSKKLAKRWLKEMLAQGLVTESVRQNARGRPAVVFQAVEANTPIARAWARLRGRGPSRMRRLRQLPWREFASKVKALDEDFADDLVSSLWAGDIWLLKGAFDEGWMRTLQAHTHKWWSSVPSEFHKMLEGTPNFHRIIDLEAGKAYSFQGCKHSAYFYRFNEDPLNVWPAIDERWRVFKMAMGLTADAYEKNTPKDGVIDRVQIVRYPPAVGYLEPHSDPYLHQRCFTSAYMSKMGVDFQGGGFYAVGEDDKPVWMEAQIEVGDASFGYAGVCHGVAPCDRHLPCDWEKTDGRWFLSMYSNASDEVPQRHTARPEKVHVEGVLP